MFALVGVSFYCIVSLVIGVRLLMLARRTRELPEFLIGLAFLIGGMLGYTMLVVATQLTESSPTVARTLFFSGMFLIAASAALLLRFWSRVYHADHWAARKTFVVGTTLLFGGLLLLWVTTPVGTSPSISPWFPVVLFGQGAAYALNAYASVSCYRSLRRRLALDLVDPEVVNRVLLWAISAATVTCQYVYSIAVVAVAPADALIIRTNPTIISGLGLLSAALVVLAFFPPRTYRRWLARTV